MITEDYVSFEVAKLLKEKGFEQLCDYAYTNKGNYFEVDRSNFDEIYCFRPTHQRALKWLREVRGIILEPHHAFGENDKIVCSYAIFMPYKTKFEYIYDTDYLVPIEAVEAALKYVLTNLI